LDLSERIAALHVQRGATPHERARLRLNSAEALLRLRRPEEAEEGLRHCQAVFEEAEDGVLLGEGFRARARGRAALNRPADALTMAEAALRYCYEGSSPESLAGAHDALVEYLGASGRSGREVMAHRTAAVLLRAAAVHAEQGATVIEVSDVLEYGPE